MKTLMLCVNEKYILHVSVAKFKFIKINKINILAS